MREESVRNPFRQFTDVLIASSALMILLGVLAIVVPTAAGIGVVIVIGWLIVIGGIAHLIYAFAAWGIGSFLWGSLLGFIYVGAGTYFVIHPQISLVSFTLALAILLCVEGILEIVLSAFMFNLSGSGWLLLDGIVTLLLSIMIWRTWPSSAAWAIGILLGVNLIVSGFARLSYAIVARKVAKTLP